MRVIFAGTPDFAVPALEAICAAGHAVPLVLTQPDRPAGRGMSCAESAVKRAAVRHGIPVHQPVRLKDPAVHAPIAAARADVMVVAAYGLILPQAVLDLPRLGAVNIHGSLLPRWRGAAPIQRALLAGDARTGVCIMQMDAGLDTGPVLMREALDISPDETAASLHDKLAALGARLIVAALEGLGRGVLVAEPQSKDGAAYADKIEKQEARLDWRRDAAALERAVRAFDPYPGAAGRVRGAEVKVWRARVLVGPTAPAGEVVSTADEGVVVGCGNGLLRLEVLQRAGGKRLAAADFLRGFPLAAGDRFETD